LKEREFRERERRWEERERQQARDRDREKERVGRESARAKEAGEKIEETIMDEDEDVPVPSSIVKPPPPRMALKFSHVCSNDAAA
jgi:hypothetical protein